MGSRIAGLLVGVVFGVTLSWTGMTSPEVIRETLLFESAYLFLFFGSAVLVAFVGTRLLRAAKVRALLTGEPISWKTERPQSKHVIGSVIFGTGWAIADACPGPVATQLGQGIAWGLFTLAGITIGIVLFQRREQPARVPRKARSAPPVAAGR